MVENLAMAIRFYDNNRDCIERDGEQARERVLERYDWEKKGMWMKEQYERAVLAGSERIASRGPEPGFGRTLRLTNLLFSLRGVAIAFAALLLVGTLFFMSLGMLKKQARSIVSDNLPGLSYAGEIEASLSAAFNRTLLILLTQSPEKRVQLEDELNTLSDQTTSVLDAYKTTILTPADEAIYERVLAKRADYRRLRSETFKLVNQDQMTAASAYCQTQLLPAFNAYKSEADKLLEFNMQASRANGESIMRICTATQIIVAAIGVLIFVAGFLVGVSR
jgi:hypothetical protein